MNSGLQRVFEELASIRSSLNVKDSVTDREISDAIARSTPAIIVDLETGDILASTAPADELFGYIRGEIAGKRVHDLIPERLHEKHEQHFRKFADNPSVRQMGKREMELVGLHRDGHEFRVEIALWPEVIRGKRCAIATILGVDKA